MTSPAPSSGFGLPSPEALEHLEKVSPGFTKFLQKELVAHREAQEKSETRAHEARTYRLETERRLATRGQQFGLTIGIVAICAGTLAALFQAQIAGSFIGAGGVIGLVAVFVVQSRLPGDDRPQKGVATTEQLRPRAAA
jgi:uncharacterized membrane protein